MASKKNPFKSMSDLNKKPSAHLKKNVIHNVALIQLMQDFSGLFLSNIPTTLGQQLSKNKN